MRPERSSSRTAFLPVVLGRIERLLVVVDGVFFYAAAFAVAEIFIIVFVSLVVFLVLAHFLALFIAVISACFADSYTILL